MSNHDSYRDGSVWLPFYADGYVQSVASITTLECSFEHRNQPIGFSGANPGPSKDNRGFPRIRIKAISVKL